MNKQVYLSSEKLDSLMIRYKSRCILLYKTKCMRVYTTHGSKLHRMLIDDEFPLPLFIN